MDNFNKSEYISCKPISTLTDLLSWPYTNNINRNERCRKFSVEKLKEKYHTVNDKSKRKMIVCHDMKNNYLEDRYFQGFNTANAFSFYHWNLIDMFIYFSHHLVTIPPESWINSAHTNNVRILGTFITEFDSGKIICDEFLSDKPKIDIVVSKLVEITLFYGFDGWLINIENPIDNVENLKYFVKSLTQSLKQVNPTLYKIVWYDSVIETGQLKWQNELNELNREFFNMTDGFFVNYTWKEKNLLNTKTNALDRISDVFVGIDVFGRGCLGDGGFNTNIAFDAVVKHDMNVALFAPGWLHECQNPNEFIQNCEKFWKLLEAYTQRHELVDLPIVTSFTHGCAKNFFINGKRIQTSNKFNNNNINSTEEIGWYNLNLQSLMPIISVNGPNASIEWFYEDAYYGGNSLLIRDIENFKLFDCNISLEKKTNFYIEYVYKINGKDQFESFQDICLSIEYYTDDNISNLNQLNLTLIMNVTDIFDLKIKQSTDKYGWNKRSYYFHLNKKIIIKSINVVMLNKREASTMKKSFLLGLLRIFEIKENLAVKLEISRLNRNISYKSSLFYLEKSVYLCIHLTWPKLNNENDLNYYNILIDDRNLIELENLKKKKLENKKHDEIEIPIINETPDLILVGSTRVEKFQLCLKLNKEYKIEPTSFSQPPFFSFNVFVHAIDKNMNNMIEFNDEIQTLSESSNSSIINANIEISGIRKQTDSCNLNFLDNILYDYEYFNIS